MSAKNDGKSLVIAKLTDWQHKHEGNIIHKTDKEKKKK